MDFTNLKLAKMEIKVLGTGCAKCKSLENNTKEAVNQLAIEANIIKVEDIVEIMKTGVMTTPALVVDGNVVAKGKVPSVSEIKDLLTNK
jgi:small redox-active disulfide protein 2